MKTYNKKNNKKHTPYVYGILKDDNRYSIPNEGRRKMSEAKRGEKHPNWKGGITSKNNNIRHSREYKLWRISVFERDNYTCIWCKKRSKKGLSVVLHADHIKPFAYFPELRFAIDNGRTLCVPCHKTTDTYCNGAKYIYGQKTRQIK